MFLRCLQDALLVQGQLPVLYHQVALAEHGLHVQAVGGVGRVGDRVLRERRTEVGRFAVQYDEVGVFAGLDGTDAVRQPYRLGAVDGAEVQ
ncbi:MAG: hypothetical protein PWQ62_1228 [Candidatus Methanomethylophilaceae archaeon]|nr:hypothetical protein [Candidatus Methanomethylophilaceae archaeon]